MVHQLHYAAPATTATEALLLGNGRDGAMIHGGVRQERIDLNADTLWSGGPVPARTGPPPAAGLPALRDAVLRDGDHERADRLAAGFQGPFGQGYQPLGALLLDFPDAAGPEAGGRAGVAGPEAGGRASEATGYARVLDLDRAVHTVEYLRGGVHHRREAFQSAPAGVLVLDLTVDRPGALAFSARLTSPHPRTTHAVGPSGALLTGRAPAHLEFDRPAPLTYLPDAGTGFAAALHVEAVGGTVRAAEDGTLTVTGADRATLTIALATGYRGWRERPVGPEDGPVREACHVLATAVARPYRELLEEHVRDHRALYRRCSLRLGPAGAVGALPTSALPTDERLAAFRATRHDPGLTALLFAYGRYLLIASSRPGSQPANLQGIWNDDTAPPWNSNWTTNVNLPMNYWPAEITNLAECHQPLLSLVEDLAEAGAPTARDLYGCRGWTVHHNTDLWRPTAPVAGSPSWAMWPMAGAWLCAHLWEHYRYGGDRAFLAERAYPAMRGAALFLLDFLVEDGDGALVTCPSTSPEHHFRTPGGGYAAVTAGTTMDLELARELFADCAAAARELGTDEEFANRLDQARARLREPGVGAGGRLQEWDGDFPPEDPGHRHFSHLYGLFPGERIDPVTTPGPAAAAAAALRHRLDHGGGSTGWSAAWAAALAARLGDGASAHRALTELLAAYTFPNLTGMCPPEFFQIDATFGATAAIARCLLQSHQDVLRLLPALPADWPEGTVTGLRAPGGVTVGIGWAAGTLTWARVGTVGAGELTVRLPAGTGPVTVTDGVGRVVPHLRKDEDLHLTAGAETVLTIRPA
ncbi:glycosyl hydrolase family 95 catalytic domain-containing protein [Kitasatospora sp. NPDC096147]|uniref:glycoside hydrolase family 95 protein n=1 Tax=Kitasatospora sp. NPDC096147 TaxID=3364093 RepID=UPI0037F7C394